MTMTKSLRWLALVGVFVSAWSAGPVAAQSVETLDKGSLSIAFTGDMPGTGYQDGKMIGYDGEILQRIADALKLKVKPALMDWSGTIASVQAKRVDVMAGTMGWTELQTVISRLMKMLMRKGVLIEEMGQTYLALIRFHGVLAPNAKLRALVVPQGPPAHAQAPAESAAAAECEVETAQARPHRIGWARLLKRVFDIDMQHCPNCGGGELKIIAAILRGEPGRRRS